MATSSQPSLLCYHNCSSSTSISSTTHFPSSISLSSLHHGPTKTHVPKNYSISFPKLSDKFGRFGKQKQTIQQVKEAVDDCLPSSLEGATQRSNRASASFVEAGGKRAVVGASASLKKHIVVNKQCDFDRKRYLLSTKHSSQRKDINIGVDSLHKNSDNLAVVMLSYAERGNVEEAQMLWDVSLNSSYTPSAHVVSSLMTAYATNGHFYLIFGILGQIKNREFSWLPQVYSHAIKCFGVAGQLDFMERTLNDMVSMGFQVNSVTGNAYVVYYSMFGSLAEMEAAYGRLKKSQFLLQEEGIRAVSFAYVRENKFYALGEFLRDVGLGRRNVGNLLWNLLLLSYAAKFKMKSLQREFLAMLEAGFQPDLTTFNIRALAFSKMNLFWDLHLSLEHMRHEEIVPDLVTYGCVVDAYMDKRMGKNLDFALQKMINLDERPSIRTDPFVFEVMGKSEFHLNAEAFMEFNKHKGWTYRKLIGLHVKKQYRSNQIFWNY